MPLEGNVSAFSDAGKKSSPTRTFQKEKLIIRLIKYAEVLDMFIKQVIYLMLVIASKFGVTKI